MRTCLGGTFEPLHAGHKALLRAAALDATDLFVGVTDEALAARKTRHVSSWTKRAAAVERFLRKDAGYTGPLTLRALTDPWGPAATGDYDRIVVSPETAAGADRINAKRRKDRRKPLAVLVVPHVLGADLLPVSSTAVHDGRITLQGRRRTPVLVAVGSANAVKVRAVETELSAILPGKPDVKGHAVQSRVPEQPKGAQTLKGARNRAEAARRAEPDCDYAVGVEAGLIRLPGSTDWLEAQACVVLDRNGVATEGWGPAFAYPEWVTARALQGEMVSGILGPVAKDPRIGSTTGAIGYLSDGRMDRTALTQVAVRMAMLPRIRRALYTTPPH